jgi:outer membrane lipoprotein SlyB
MRTLPNIIVLAFATLPLSAVSQQSVYPSKGQTPSQQQTDESQCSTWAVQQSGYNPANPPAVAKAQTAPVTGSGARVGGAAAGAAVGAIGGNDVGNAAAKGAVAGGVVRRNKNRAAAAQQNEAAAQQQQAGAASYWNARQACLQGRGYSVK